MENMEKAQLGSRAFWSKMFCPVAENMVSVMGPLIRQWGKTHRHPTKHDIENVCMHMVTAQMTHQVLSWHVDNSFFSFMHSLVNYTNFQEVSASMHYF